MGGGDGTGEVAYDGCGAAEGYAAKGNAAGRNIKSIFYIPRNGKVIRGDE